jgi:hypothetical protein
MHKLTRATALGALTFGALTLAACGSDGPPRPDSRQAEIYMNGLGGRGVAVRPGTDINAVYAEAIGLKDRGDCAAATPKLRMVANMGVGYENAQTALGECLLQVTAISELSADYLEGLTWLRRAGDAGWPEAQFRLATAHALGPTVIRNEDEAAYWFALYNTNTGKSRVGFISPSGAQIAAVDTALSPAAKAAGKTRAATWQRKVWIPPVAPTQPGPTGKRMQRNESLNGRSER